MKRFFVVIAFFLFFLCASSPAQAVNPACVSQAICYRNGCGPNQQALYEYTKVTCTGVQGPNGCDYSATTSDFTSQSLQNQNTPSNYHCTEPCGDPAGYGVNPQCSTPDPQSDPSCPGGNTRSGSCPGGLPCSCQYYEHTCCNEVPLQCKTTLGCPGGTGGSTPTPTPTPTPAPSCELTCPGTPITAEQFTRFGGTVSGGTTVGGGGSTTDGSAAGSGYYQASGIAEGNISFTGSNGFNCTSFTAGTGSIGACPAPTIVPAGGTGGTTGTGGTGGTDVVLGASTSNTFVNKLLNKIQTVLPSWLQGKVLGASTLLAQSVGTGGTGTGTGSTGQTTIWSQAVRYHKVPTSPNQIYTATARDLSGVVGHTGGYSCSCSVVLTCPASAQDPNAAGSILEGCDNQCDFVVSPTVEHTGSPYTFTIETPPGFDNIVLDYDDGNSDTDSHFTTGGTLDHTYSINGVFDVTLSCTTNGGGAERTCKRRLASYCEATPLDFLPTPTPSPTPTPGPWIKVMNASFHSHSTISSSVPSGATAYDTSDRGSCSASNPNAYACFSSGQAGVVTVKSPVGDFGTEVSARGWVRRDTNYTMNSLITPASFIEYMKARKDYSTITAFDANQIEANTISFFTPDTIATLLDDSIPNKLAAGQGVVIVVNGDMVIDMDDSGGIFNTANRAVTFIVNGELDISSGTTEINGTFIANTVNFAYDAVGAITTPLKVHGNITSLNSSVSQCQEIRQRTDKTKPSCFIQSDVVHQILPVMDMLSTRTYEWTDVVQ